MDFAWTGFLFAALLASAAAGWAAQAVLQERHVTRETVDSIRLIMGMLLTFSALVLGLLTSSAKQRFDGFNTDLSRYGAYLIELDHRLRVYGPEAEALRGMLRRYTASALADTWPQEPAPAGVYPRMSHVAGEEHLESDALGDMLSALDSGIEHLAPPDSFHQITAARLRDRVALVIQQRWTLIFSARSTLSMPFLVILTAWLCIIYAILGLTAPRSRLVYAVVALSAVSIAAPLYLILYYDEAWTGQLQLSSEPIRSALAHMDQDH